MTQLDVAYTANTLTIFSDTPGPKPWQVLTKAPQYLKRTASLELMHSYRDGWAETHATCPNTTSSLPEAQGVTLVNSGLRFLRQVKAFMVPSIVYNTQNYKNTKGAINIATGNRCNSR